MQYAEFIESAEGFEAEGKWLEASGAWKRAAQKAEQNGDQSRAGYCEEKAKEFERLYRYGDRETA